MIEHVWVTVRQPSEASPRGEVESGHFRIEHGVVVLVDQDGRELRGERGAGYRHKLVGEEDAHQAARRLVRQAYFDRRDDGVGGLNGRAGGKR